MRSLTLSQWRDLRIGVICEDLGALMVHIGPGQISPFGGSAFLGP